MRGSPGNGTYTAGGEIEGATGSSTQDMSSTPGAYIVSVTDGPRSDRS
jgi:hypothetical protein